MRKLVSTFSGLEYPFERLEEFADNGEALEVTIEGIERSRPPGKPPPAQRRGLSFMAASSTSLSLIR